jgi:hypothetical protein
VSWTFATLRPARLFAPGRPEGHSSKNIDLESYICCFKLPPAVKTFSFVVSPASMQTSKIFLRNNMFKALSVALLLASGATAHAAQTWNFTYTGFYDENANVFDATRKVAGSFTGSDDNSDGILGKSEITAFFLNDVNYIACSADSNPYYQCGTDRFSYEIGGKLEFFAGTTGNDPEGLVSVGHYFDAGNRERRYRFTPTSTADASFLWTNDTQFQISAIPEPGAWMMMGAGLLLVGAMVRRK